MIRTQEVALLAFRTVQDDKFHLERVFFDGIVVFVIIILHDVIGFLNDDVTGFFAGVIIFNNVDVIIFFLLDNFLNFFEYLRMTFVDVDFQILDRRAFVITKTTIFHFQNLIFQLFW